MPAAVVFPQLLVREIVEVEVFEMAEFAPCRGEQLLAEADVSLHRAAHVEEQQYLHRIPALGHEFQVEQPAIARSGGDSAFEIELVRRAFARKAPQAAQREFQIARAELDSIVKIAVLTRVPHFHRAPLALLRLAHANTLRVVALRAKR